MRAKDTDFYNNARFRVMDSGLGYLTSIAGFTTCTVPEYTLNAVEYREGNRKFAYKQPGNVTVSDVTLTKGMAKLNTQFYDWILATINGVEYRTDLEIWHFHRDDSDWETEKPGAPTKKIILNNAFPIRCKPGADLDAASDDINIMELDVALESFTLEMTA